MGAEEFCRQFGELKGMARALEKLEAGESPATTAAALEFICEGLHLGKRLNKTPPAPAPATALTSSSRFRRALARAAARTSHGRP